MNKPKSKWTVIFFIYDSSESLRQVQRNQILLILYKNCKNSFGFSFNSTKNVLRYIAAMHFINIMHCTLHRYTNEFKPFKGKKSIEVVEIGML